MGNKKDTRVGTMVSEELNSEANEIVSISGHEAAAILGGPLQLLPVRPSESAHLVSADSVDTPYSNELSDGGADVLIEVKLHDRLTASEGC